MAAAKAEAPRLGGLDMASPRGKLAFFSAYLRAALEGALRLVYAATWIVAHARFLFGKGEVTIATIVR